MNVTILFFLTLFTGVNANPPVNPPADCSRMEVSYTTQTVGDKVTIDVRASGGEEPYYYFFLDKKNNPLTCDFKKSNHSADKSNLPKLIRVADSKGCIKTIDFNESANR
jgi:hypothetical protein